jgi:putative hydrolase of the HAD superfamily
MPVILLDFGGVIHRSALELFPAWAAQAGLPARISARSGPFGTQPDQLWERMQRRELTERGYWEDRAREVGACHGEKWSAADLLLRLADVAEEHLVRPEIPRLLDLASAAGISAGVLSNDIEHFYGAAWVRRQQILRRFSALVDGSVTGVLKPDPQAYLLAADALGVPVSELVFIDDQPWNVQAAAKLGATAIHLDITDPSPAFAAAEETLGLGLPSQASIW